MFECLCLYVCVDIVKFEVNFFNLLNNFIIFCRWHDNFFNQFNFAPLLLVCIVRTSIELFLLSTVFWPENWCQAAFFLILFQMQTICILLAVFIFQNGILTLLVAKIYLSKNYSNCLHALTKSRRLQMFISPVFTLIHLVPLYSLSERDTCWPRFSDTPIINLLILSPLLQMVLVSVVAAGGPKSKFVCVIRLS